MALDPVAPTNAEVSAADRAHVFHSWSAQHLINPVPLAGGAGCEMWDHDGNRWLDFSLAAREPQPRSPAPEGDRRHRRAGGAAVHGGAVVRQPDPQRSGAADRGPHARRGSTGCSSPTAAPRPTRTPSAWPVPTPAATRCWPTYRSYHGATAATDGAHRRAPPLGLRAGDPRRRPLPRAVPLPLVVRRRHRRGGGRPGDRPPGGGDPVRGARAGSPRSSSRRWWARTACCSRPPTTSRGCGSSATRTASC